MGLFSSIGRAFVNPLNLAQLALGPAGWASLAMRTIGSQIAMNVIQKIGQQLGLPQPMIDIAQAAFANASGQPGLMRQNISEAVRGLTQQLDLRPSEAGQLQRELMGASDKSFTSLNDIMQNAVDGMRRRGGSGGEEEGGSWLVALARAMGQVLDQKAAQIKEQSELVSFYGSQEVKKKDGSLTAKSQENQNKLSSASVLLQAFAQEMSFISNAATNAIKSVGEAQTALARK